MKEIFHKVYQNYLKTNEMDCYYFVCNLRHLQVLSLTLVQLTDFFMYFTYEYYLCQLFSWAMEWEESLTSKTSMPSRLSADVLAFTAALCGHVLSCVAIFLLW